MRDGAYTDSGNAGVSDYGEDTQSELMEQMRDGAYTDSENTGVSDYGEDTQSELMEQMRDGAYTDSENTGVSDYGEDAQKELMERMRDSPYTDSVGENKESHMLGIICRKKEDKKEDKKEESLSSVPIVRRGEGGKLDIRPKTNKKKNKKKSFLLNDGFNPYLFAIEILNEYRIWHLDPSDWTLWIWNGQFYEPLNDAKLETLIYSKLPEEFKSTMKSCKKSIQATAEYIQRECAASPIKSKNAGKYYRFFDKKKMLEINNQVVLKNGVYDVMTKQLLPFDEKKPYYYDINAKYLKKDSSELETPYFDKLLEDATGNDKESIQMIRWALGMLLLPNKCKKFIVAGNASNSGKSILFGQFLDSLFDANRISRVDSSKLGGRFALGDCEDKLLVSCLDIDENVLSSKAVGVIKRATGEEKISSEAKYKSSKETIVRFKFLFATNFGFTSKRYDPGLVNRILALPFIHETPEYNQMADLPERLYKERDAIVTKILREMQSVIKEDGSIVIPESDLSKQMKASWTTVNSFFEEFCDEVVDVTGDREDYISWEELYEAYEKYFFLRARSSNGHCEILPKQAFTKSFTEKAEIGKGGKVELVRSRKFGEQEYPNAVRRLKGIKVKI